MDLYLKIIGGFVALSGSLFGMFKYFKSEKDKQEAYNHAEKELKEMITDGQEAVNETLKKVMAIVKATELKVAETAKKTDILLQMHKYTAFSRTLPAVFRNRLNSLTNSFPSRLAQKLSMAFDKVLPNLIEIIDNDFQHITAESIENQLINKAKEMKTLLLVSEVEIDSEKVLQLQKELKLLFVSFSLNVAEIPEKYENGKRGVEFRDLVLLLIEDVVKSTNTNLIN